MSSSTEVKTSKVVQAATSKNAQAGAIRAAFLKTDAEVENIKENLAAVYDDALGFITELLDVH